MSDVSELLERVKAAKRPSYDLDLAIEQAVGPFPDRLVGAYSQSVDEALALVARVLPGWRLDSLQDMRDEPYTVCGLRNDAAGHMIPRAWGNGATRPLAILAALLTALKGHSPP